ncbi:MAG: 30S ribosomal protein S3 [Candidatus Asgardarchaeia archaeon]
MKAKQHFLERNLLKIQLNEFLANELTRAGYAGVELVKTPLGTRIIIKAARPGLVIGKHGKTVRDLTQKIEELFHIENPQIEVDEITEPELNAKVMAQRLASALQRGVHFRRAGYTVLRRIMNAGARGAEITISGKLTSQRARYQKFRAGVLIKAGDPVNHFVDVGKATVLLKPGMLGITVKIMLPEAPLPDEMKISDIDTSEIIEESGELEEIETNAGEKSIAEKDVTHQEETSKNN